MAEIELSVLSRQCLDRRIESAEGAEPSGPAFWLAESVSISASRASIS